MPANVTQTDLESLEREVAVALDRRDHSDLTVLGFGEISIALGYPTGNPRVVAKRTPPFAPAQFEHYRELVDDYRERLDRAGIRVAPTRVMSVERDGRFIGYLIQPLLPSESLGNNVLTEAEPDPDQPFLAALAESMSVVSPRLSIDAQVTNWSWDGAQLTLLDVGTPFMWDEVGELLFDMRPFLAMLPTAVRPLVRRDMLKVVSRWQEPRRVAIDAVANLYREGLIDWVEPAIIAFNRVLGPAAAITADEARAFYEEDAKTFPRLKRLQRAERAWRTSVRRQPYDFFVQDSTYR